MTPIDFVENYAPKNELIKHFNAYSIRYTILWCEDIMHLKWLHCGRQMQHMKVIPKRNAEAGLDAVR